ncbi:MAG: acyl-CoA thioesterase [Proteobacteria bacterium]|nr:acyl-CoA thioesterase [Pseudomonadota bacterium]
MYPIFRFAKEMLVHRRADKLLPTEIHVSSHLCWPWDVDPWMELNNGRTLTLYDLGRMPLLSRLRMTTAMKKQGWGMAVAGASVRYRRRVKMFQRLKMQSTLLGWDERFFYFQQSMWHKGEASSSILIRSAMTDQNGIAAPQKAASLLGWGDVSPALPDYVIDWIAAEGQRPWPPVV